MFQSTWDATHSSAPTLFGGQKFMLTPADNRYGLPAFYSLHAWIWKHNPKGTFEQWNPQVHCGGSQASGVDANDQAAAAPSMVGMGETFICPVPAVEPAIDMEPSALGPRSRPTPG